MKLGNFQEAMPRMRHLTGPISRGNYQMHNPDPTGNWIHIAQGENVRPFNRNTRISSN